MFQVVIEAIALVLAIGSLWTRGPTEVGDDRSSRSALELAYIGLTFIAFLAKAAVELHVHNPMWLVIASYGAAGIWFFNGVRRNPWKHVWMLGGSSHPVTR